ncbi:MAPEG family protein [Luteimonas aquatica]|uniref:MAPEG family protein n=1 Tax=Luteimonas aquatica TaxID=450364 RepID=UPI001F59DBAC|nr:MAPEG family protein [Luteimonas aquatica]
MATAYWCIVIAAVLPYLWVFVAKSGGPRYDNRDPRGWISKQENPRVKRADAAHLNSFEAFAPFAAGVLMAQFSGLDPQRINVIAVVFVVARLLHGVLYLTNKPPLRSLAWLVGYVCILALMVQSAIAIAD